MASNPQTIEGQSSCIESPEKPEKKKRTRVAPAAKSLPAAAPEAQPPAVVDPMRIIELAVTQGADVEKLERLMALQERFEANNARKAFFAALAQFKEKGLVVTKDGEVNYTTTKGTTFYRHAKLSNVVATIGPALSECGLSWRWETKQESAQEGPDKITVTCILSHVLGYSERTSLYCFPDVSGNKNSIQGIGSAVKYLERYTLMAATGTSDTDDNDGRIDDDQDDQDDKGKKPSGRPELPACSDEYFAKVCKDAINPDNGEIMRFGIKSLVEMGENTTEATIDFLSTKVVLTEKQIAEINSWKKKP